MDKVNQFKRIKKYKTWEIYESAKVGNGFWEFTDSPLKLSLERDPFSTDIKQSMPSLTKQNMPLIHMYPYVYKYNNKCWEKG